MVRVRSLMDQKSFWAARLGLTVLDEADNPLDADNNVVEVILGLGHLVPKVEAAVSDLQIGQRASVPLLPEEAFGDHDPERVVAFERSEFPEDTVAGDCFDADGDDGPVVLQVVEVTDDSVIVDLNHPLAGKSVTMIFEMLDKRPVGDEELRAIEAKRLTEVNVDGNGLLPVNSLLRGRTKR